MCHRACSVDVLLARPTSQVCPGLRRDFSGLSALQSWESQADQDSHLLSTLFSKSLKCKGGYPCSHSTEDGGLSLPGIRNNTQHSWSILWLMQGLTSRQHCEVGPGGESFFTWTRSKDLACPKSHSSEGWAQTHTSVSSSAHITSLLSTFFSPLKTSKNTAETSTALESNSPPIKNKFKIEILNSWNAQQ